MSDDGSVDTNATCGTTTTKEVVCTPNAIPPLSVFSQAVKSKGHVYVSGCIGCDSEYLVVEGGIQAQTRAALENISKILEASGSGMQHVVKVTVYLVHMARDFLHMNEIYEQFFTRETMPARTCIGVSALPMGAFIEIDCIAEVLDTKSS
ncbi:Endoribonuclease L-PSP [Pisolithus orientalis]|uniref:Endoribonuclease L-PSP n=1 Tax=Pisolithus orientalis TaxID=936130 RepID=UPI00222585EE|nr:Endoribonuclease L-PSP [Pisolithus orientalis]KAI6010942.1 Endoribonuclease L-PSP [Pisolithus orientalis]